MDFDEYDYLEKAIESPKPQKTRETATSILDAVKSGDKDNTRSLKHKVNEKDDAEQRSKRSRSRDESHDDRDRGLSQHSFRSRDREREQHRNSRPYMDREKRDRNRMERNARERDGDGDKVGLHDRDRERRERDQMIERDREREQQRQSRSHRSERRQSDNDKRAIETIHDGDYGNGRLKERNRGNRQNKEKKEEVKEPEPDPERDQRTVFAYQISLKASERDVYEFFSRAGKVRDARLIQDRISRRSKGVGYIEFFDAMSVPMAIALSGQPLHGQPVMVKPSEAEKNQVQSTTSAGGSGGLVGGAARKLYVGNLHTSITEDNLRQVFEAFGIVELVQLPLDETGQCKGFGFVQFTRLEDARNAVSLNGLLEIAGRVIKVSVVTDQAGMQDLGANSGDFDDEDGGVLSLNARSRAFLMQKLDRSGTASSIAGSLGAPVFNGAGLSLPIIPIGGAASVASSFVAPLGSVTAFPGLGGAAIHVPNSTASLLDALGAPSECLLLKNMFDPEVESEPNFDLDIKDDVEEECSRFGKIKHIFVDRNTAGFVYLRFENSESAINSQRALNGRWFAGKMITATFMDCLSYEVRFPDSG